MIPVIFISVECTQLSKEECRGTENVYAQHRPVSVAAHVPDSSIFIPCCNNLTCKRLAAEKAIAMFCNHYPQDCRYVTRVTVRNTKFTYTQD